MLVPALSIAWVLAARAGEEDCPDPERAVFGAEQDAVSFFLNDAQLAIAEAVDGFACAGPADGPLVARFWQAQAMIWYLQDDLDRARRGFVAARAASPEVWNPDYGEQAREMFDSATLEAGEPARVDLRGFGGADWVRVDGIEARAPLKLGPGLHLVQVGREDEARFARVLDIAGGEALTVSVPATGAPPDPIDTAPAPIVARAADGLGPRPIPPIAEGLVIPLERVRGGRYADATGRTITLRSELLAIARYDLDGRVARRRYRSNLAGQVTALGIAGSGLYAAYLFGWDYTTGLNYDRTVSGGVMGAGVLAFVVGTAWEVKLLVARPKRRAQVEAAAERVVQGRAL